MNDETIAIVNTPRSIGVVEAMKQVNCIDNGVTIINIILKMVYSYIPLQRVYPLPTVTSQYWQTEQQCCEITMAQISKKQKYDGWNGMLNAVPPLHMKRTVLLTRKK
ncbi:hypothetical protein M8J75_003464 [Diaphorina citri]|nr:hypothetical protein M8J75_003464 [Diaphorina citri]